jgi:DNA-binding CsgD family transcriptional regulator
MKKLPNGSFFRWQGGDLLDSGILLYQLVTLLVGVVSATMAFCLFLWEGAPLTRKFLVAALVINAYYFLAGVAAYVIRVAGAFDPGVETVFSLLNFLLFALLIPTWTSFLLELLQRPFTGAGRLVSRSISVLGVLAPVAILVLPLDAPARALVLRYGLYGAYVLVVLGYFLVLSVAAFRRAARIADEWKRVTLRGTCVLLWCGLPFLLTDALWPWLQVEGGWLPRALNFQGVFLAAFGVFYGFRWAALFRLVPTPERDLAYDQAKVAAVDLTDRERQVFDLLFQECSNQDLVARLGISLGTAKNHVYHIFQKTGASSRRELVRMFRLPPPPSA